MRQISDIGKQMLNYQAKLAEEHNYKPIPINLFTGNVRDKYEETLPEWCKDEDNKTKPLYTTHGTKLSNGYKRIVIGDYGAFVEITPEQICKEVLECKKGQEYRIEDERFASRVKYIWLTTKDKSDCKVYWQKKGVDYADYQPNMYYISPYEVFLTKE